ncbi:MAG TPA: RNase adapter RapZ, partial [Armatimonadota bacterium]
MELVIVSGMSGAGKTTAIRAFEDMGYYCVDNLPPDLLPNLREIYAGDQQNGKIAVVVDVRSGESFRRFVHSVADLSGGFDKARILFMDASDEVLVQRFK